MTASSIQDEHLEGGKGVKDQNESATAHDSFGENEDPTGGTEKTAAAGTTDTSTSNDTSRPASSSWCRGRLPTGEVLGLCCINIAMGSVTNANVFMSTGLLYLARLEAGCIPGIPCDTKVHGMNPDSLLTNIAWMGSLVVAFTLPIIGAIVDYTPYRRQVGILASAALVALNAAQIALSADNWWPLAIVQVVAGWAYFILRTVTQPYVPELSDDLEKQNKYNSSFTGLFFSSMVVCMIVVIALSMIPGVDSVDQARIGQMLLVATSTITLSYAFSCLLGNRDAVDEVPDGYGGSTVLAGFGKVYRTSREVCAKYHAIMWFFVSAMFTGAGQAGFASTIITVAMAVLGMDGTMVGLMVFTIFVFGIFGGALSHLATKRMDPLRSLMGSLILFVVTTSIAAGVLSSPDRKMLSFLFAALWGAAMGWSLAAEQTLFAMILPDGAPAELYGTWYFFSFVLSWVPPLLFSILNENRVSMQWGLASIAFFFLFAFVFLLPIGGFKKAIDQVTETDVDGVPSIVSSDHRLSTTRRRSSVAIKPPVPF